MIEIGRLCVKTAGRDAGRECVVVDVVSKNIVLIDGQTRRRKCNINHLEPLSAVLKIKKGESHSEIAKEFKKLGMVLKETKPKKAAARPVKQRAKKKARTAPEEKTAEKKETKKETKKEKKSEKKPKEKK